MNQKIYLDNGSTSFPKAPPVADAVYHYLTELGTNINRGCYNDAYEMEELVYETRQMVCDLFHGPSARNVIFTKNVTESLNILLKGYLKPGDHVLVSSMEHNAVMRPLVQLAKTGISFSRIPCAPDGSLMTDKIPGLILPNTRAIVLTHASNVCGTLLPLEQVGAICQEYHLAFFVDCAQTAGVFPIDMERMHIDALAFTGHKGLLGPQGIGGFILQDHLISQIAPLLSGGTGSISHTEEIPDFLPDRFEPGTMNLPGIVGLHASLSWIARTTIDTIRRHELGLTEYFLSRLQKLDPQEEHIRLIGKRTSDGRTGVISIQMKHLDNAQAAYQLDEDYGIMTRVGLHCAPNAHKTLGTYPAGTIRFSVGFWNTADEIDAAIAALEEIIQTGEYHGI